MSLYLNPNSPKCARFSCGGVIDCCRAVVEGQIRNAFAIVRPPGHHAEPEQEMGFCFFNNVAVAAKYMRTAYPEKIKRILVLDWLVFFQNSSLRSLSSLQGRASRKWHPKGLLERSFHSLHFGSSLSKRRILSWWTGWSPRSSRGRSWQRLQRQYPLGRRQNGRRRLPLCFSKDHHANCLRVCTRHDHRSI